MAYEVPKNELPHKLTLENRNRLSITGVQGVESFDEETVIAVTTCGTLTVHGGEMHVERLNLDQGELTLVGKIGQLEYEENSRSEGGFFGRFVR
jgi:sporulation protein YabP